MAAVFTVCDRPHYSKLIPQHLADCAQMPEAIIQRFSKGGFVVSITGRNWNSVSFDEAHEMLVNKDLKTGIVRPNAEYMSRLSLYFTHRTKALKNLRHIVDARKDYELFAEENKSESPINFTDNSSIARKRTENVNKMIEVIKYAFLLQKDTPDNKTLRNSFTGEIATPEQREDLLDFRNIGQKEFIKFVMKSVMHLSSAKDTKRKKHKLHTFAKQKVTKQKLTNAERQKKNCISMSKEATFGTKWTRIKPATNTGSVPRVTTCNS